MNRIEVSPLFKFSQENNIKYTNPLARIFKANDTTVTEHSFVPLNTQHLNRDRYERVFVDQKTTNPESYIVFFVSPVPKHQKLSPELHKYDYVY